MAGPGALGAGAEPALAALGFEPAGGRVGITLEPIGEPVDLGAASWSMGWDDGERGPRATLVLRTSSGEPVQLTLDGVGITAWPDRRRFADAEAVPWLEQAAAGRCTEGVVAGEPWPRRAARPRA